MVHTGGLYITSFLVPFYLVRAQPISAKFFCWSLRSDKHFSPIRHCNIHRSDGSSQKNEGVVDNLRFCEVLLH